MTATPRAGSPLTEPVGAFLGDPRESLAWLALLGATAASRLVDLGTRAMSHDESLHAYYSFRIFTTGSYTHDPTYHGPLLYYANALVFWLVGASDGSARLLPALAGIGLVMSLYLFRPFLGRIGAWLAAFMVAVSPSLLFYSRFLWSDIYVALLSVLWVYCAFRHLGDPRPRWLAGVTLAMALSFLAKEVSFIFGAIIGIFFAGLWLFGARRAGADAYARPAGDLSVLMLSLALPFTAGAGYYVMGWDPAQNASVRDLLRAAALLGPLAALGGALARWWFGGARFGDWLRLALLFWSLQALFFTSFLTNAPRGLVSGVVGSLGYWLGQHETARGGQPWFYYLLLGALYEVLPLALGTCGLVAVCWRLARGHGEPPLAHSFMTFCAWWAAASWVGYAWAGEKMPWLLMHPVLPLCLLGGWWLASLLRRIGWPRARWPEALMVAAGMPALVWVVAGLVQVEPFAGRGLAAVSNSARWIVQLATAAALVLLIVRGVRATGRATGRRLAVIGLTALAALLTVRSAVRLTYVNYDLATELLVYAHGTPDIKVAMAEIKLIGERVAGGYGIEVAYDDASTWPLAWYLRDYPKARYYGTEPTPAAMAAPVIIVGSKNMDKVWPFVAQGYVRRDYRLVWWPLQDYMSAGWGDVIRTVTDPATRQRLWQFALRRRLPSLEPHEWPNGQRFAMYISRDLAQEVWNLAPPTGGATSGSAGGPVPTQQARVVEVYAGTYGGMPLRGPTAIAVAPDGARVIADAGNDRVVVLDRDGSFRLAFGGQCRLTEQPPVGCRDPDGGGPLELGDGQFHEPWGVAVDASGAIYVADTWNGRIQVFDAGGRFLRRWGRFGQVSVAHPSTATLTLYGPRGLAIDRDGALLVADTGNKRVLRFSAQGEPLQQVGGGGRSPGRFEEPVGVAVGTTRGDVWVTDTWNRRIQSFDRRFEPTGQWSVPGWEGRGAFNKPYVAVDPSGVVYTGDPERSRIYIFGAGGRLETAITLTASGPDGSLPLGLAVDPTSGDLLVADKRGNRIIALRP